MTVLEPVLFRIEPIFSPRLWGARSLAPFFPEKVNLQEPLGEAWLTATDCRIANGPFAGKFLADAWRAMPANWRGTDLHDVDDFPVLVKFIFPQETLSIQVHPGDAYAAKHETANGGRGKTEMWHIVSAKPGSEILLGLRPGVTKETFLQALATHAVENLLLRHPVQAGDTYFVLPGTQHALRPGVVVCEVQEYSDLTYRVYDFGRRDSCGNLRELQIEKALDVTNFDGNSAGKIPPLSLHSPDANKHLLGVCDYFAAERWDCRKTTFLESDPEHFQLLVILSGNGKIYDEEDAVDFRPGDTWFVPASMPTILLQPAGQASLLRVFAPDRHWFVRQLKNQGFDDAVISRVMAG